MKKLFLIITILTFSLSMAQKKFDYDSKWKQIEKQESDGLLKTNLTAIDEIYNQAKKDKNAQQIIRAMLYQSKIAMITSDEGDIEPEIITKFHREIAEANPKEKAFLQSMLAEMYYQYYQQNQWEIGERTNTEAASDDLRYWTENTFRKNISELYLASIQNKEILQKEDLKNWESVLNKEEKNRNLRPTLYDLLAHRVIAYFSGYSNYDYYAMDVVVETDENGNEINSTQSKTQIVQILKDLIAFHQQKNNSEALLYNELELLKIENQNKTTTDYNSKLVQLSQKNPLANFTSYILFDLAQNYLDLSGNEAAENFTQKKNLTEKSLSTLDKIVQNYPKSEMVENAKILKKQILKSDFNLQIENFISPEKTNPMSVTHKNLDKIYFKVLKFVDSENLMNEFQNAADANKQKALNNILSKFPLEKEFSIQLKSFDDYQQHATIAKFEPLKAGKYLVLASSNADFKVNEKFVIQSQILNVSAYSIVSRGNEILVTERESGKPVSKKVEVYEQKNRDYILTETVTTNENGLATVKINNENYRYYNFKIQGEEVLYNSYLYNERISSKETRTITKFFTDRAIYRPGQTVYFKAIVYKDENDKKSVVKSRNLNIILKNPNGEEVSKLNLTTNEFGSVSGEFMLPTSGITGEFSLENTDHYYNNYSFSVEEYKRPKFEVEFDDVKDTFKLEEEITSKGKAVAYSGANIDNAKVAYRVYRQTIYPYWPYWKRGYIPYGEPEEEIAQGETTTDSDGKFEVKFNAKPASSNLNDRVSNSSGAEETRSPRTYTYKVIADITDINGETRTGEQSVTVGDLRYLLDFNVSDKIEISKLDSIQISTNNLNGQFAPAKGELTLTKINPPNRVLRDSPIPQGDYQLYPKEEFIQYFPHDAYGKENDKENWQKENPVISQSFDTGKSKSVALNPKNWKEGYYVLKGFILDGKDSIQTEKLVYLYKNDKKQPVDNEFFAINLNQNSYKPGETAKAQFTSAATDSEVLVELEHDGKIVKSEKIKLNNSVNNFSFPIDEKYRGNVFVHYYFGKFNTAKQGTLSVNVPHEDKSLTITAGTLRDKLQPGQKETWELTVSGKDKDKFLAEMLATMYDASLDQFKSNSINFPMNVNMNYSSRQNWNTNMSFRANTFRHLIYRNDYYPQNYLVFDELNWFGFDWNYGRYENYMLLESVSARNEDMAAAPVAEMLQGKVAGLDISANYGNPGGSIKIKGNSTIEENSNALIIVDGVPMSGNEINPDDIANIQVLKGNEATALYGSRGANGVIIITTKQVDDQLNQVQSRKNLQETAFFYPNLKTDEKGNIKIQFTVPESLTEWKFMATAHTPDVRTGTFETRVRTQKDLMVVPNPPRFLREGDQITFSSKVTNLSDKELSGQAKLLLFDAFTMQPVDAEFGNNNATLNIKVAKGNSANVSWNLKIPITHQAVVYRVVASAGDFSDGEESALPILTNRMLVTETLPIYVRENQNKTFTLDKLKNNKSESLDNFKLTFEMTTNPIWYAIFSLPYLREFPYECSEQVFSRFYGNMISQHIINSNPKIKTVFDDWNAKGELVSKLEQNEELKSLLLEETPWVRDAQSEEEQMKRIAVLFDLNKMQNELQSAFQKLKGKQYSSGGFPWFEGGQESRYITTHIVSGLGHLKAMGIDFEFKFDVDATDLLEKAVRFMDAEMEKEFDIYVKNNKLKPSNYNGIQYLYARSYFLREFPLNKKGMDIKNYFIKELDKNKLEESLQTQAMLALIFNRFDKKESANKLLTSIKDKSVQSDEMGMYWKSNVAGWYWYQAPIETQSLLIEAFDEVLNDVESVESMKVWLLKNRQTNQWESTKATTEAVFALMSTGKDWTNAEEGISVKIGNEHLSFDKLRMTNPEKAPQSGSGYIKTSWNKDEIKPEMATVEVNKTSPGVAWGAVYWQYFEDLDKITTAQTGVKFNKELFIKKNSDKGPVLTKITPTTPIQIGDLITVRLEIQTDREMEFIHIKDMRASGFEPVNVLSTYKRQGRLGYYESTRDAATNFFIDFMPKGTYVFEYDVRANNAGNFSNGITSLQNMYAPELSAHSEGIRVQIDSGK